MALGIRSSLSVQVCHSPGSRFLSGMAAMRSKKTAKSKSFQAGTLGGSMMAFLCDDLFFLLTFVYSFFGRGVACLDNYFLWIVDAFFFFF